MRAEIEPRVESESARREAGADLSLQALVEILSKQESPPPLDRIRAWLERARPSRAALLPYVGFKEGTYRRRRVFRNDAAELLVICWRPGHQTPIHDHNGSHGAVRVQEGLLQEATYEFDGERGLSDKSDCLYEAGQVTGTDVPDIHRLGNPEGSGRDLVTLHIYSPPLGVLRTYKLGSPETGLYTPDDSET